MLLLQNYINTDKNKRKSNSCVSDQSGTRIFILNGILPASSNPIMQRLLLYQMVDVKRSNRSKDSMNYNSSYNNNESFNEIVKHKFKLLSTYTLFWNKLIESGALPEIDTEVSNIVLKNVFEVLGKDYGIPQPKKRKIGMLEILIKAVHIFNAININFFGEIGFIENQVKNISSILSGKEEIIKYKKINYKNFLNLLPYSWVTEEEVIYTLTLFENTFIPYGKQNLINSIISKMCTIDINNLEKMDKNLCENFKEEKLSNNQISYNYNYVTLSSNNLDNIYKQLKIILGNGLSVNNIKTLINDLKNDYMEVYNRKLVSKKNS